MRTKHVLVAIALPTIFAACTSDDVVSPITNVDFQRPTVGDVSIVLDGVSSRRVDATTGTASWTDNMGACLMDAPVSASGTFAQKYALKNTVETDYPFTLKDDAWSTTGLLLEGNYFFYYPAKENGMGRNAGLTYEVKASQNAFAEDGTYKRYQAETDNQMWISYKGFEANTKLENAQIKLNMAPLHAAVNFKVQYDGANTMQINKIVLTKKAGTFATKGQLNLNNGTSDIKNTAEYAVEYVDTIEANRGNLPAIFNVYNHEATTEKYTKSTAYNPLLQGDFLKKIGDGVSSIEVNLKNQVLASGSSVTVSMVVPNDINSTGYDIVVFTDKGVVKYDAVAPLAYTKAEELKTMELSADEAEYRKQFTEATIYENNKLNAATNKLDSIQPQGSTGIILKFKDQAIQVSKDFAVASTADLDMYMSYHVFQNYTSPTTLNATLNAADIELSKYVYDVLKANKNITLQFVKGTHGNINIGATLPTDAIDVIKVTNTGTGVAIAAGAIQKSTINNTINSVYNKGTFTIEVAPATQGATPAAKIINKLHNAGILNVNTALVGYTSHALVNGYVNEKGINNANLVTTAVMNIAASVTNVKEVENHATVNVTANNNFKYTTSEIMPIGTGADAPKTSPALTLAASKTLTLSTGSVAYGSITNNGTLTLNGSNYGTLTNNATAVVTDNYGTIDNAVAVPTGQLTVTNNHYVSETSFGIINNTIEKSMVNFTQNDGNIYAVAGSYVNAPTDYVGAHAETGNVIFTIKETTNLATLISENRSVLNSSTALNIENGATLNLNLETEEDGVTYTDETKNYLTVLSRIKAITINNAKVFVDGNLPLKNCPVYVYGNSEVTGSYGSSINFIGENEPVDGSGTTDFHKRNEILNVKKDAFLTIGVAINGLTYVTLGENAKVLADNVQVSGETAISFGTNASWFGKQYVIE